MNLFRNHGLSKEEKIRRTYEFNSSRGLNPLTAPFIPFSFPSPTVTQHQQFLFPWGPPVVLLNEPFPELPYHSGVLQELNREAEQGWPNAVWKYCFLHTLEHLQYARLPFVQFLVFMSRLGSSAWHVRTSAIYLFVHLRSLQQDQGDNPQLQEIIRRFNHAVRFLDEYKSDVCLATRLYGIRVIMTNNRNDSIAQALQHADREKAMELVRRTTLSLSNSGNEVSTHANDEILHQDSDTSTSPAASMSSMPQATASPAMNWVYPLQG
jgi:hypothetical protein